MSRNTKLTPPKSRLVQVFEMKKLSIILVGNSGVGKSMFCIAFLLMKLASLFKRFAKDEFSESPSHIVEVMNAMVEVDQMYIHLELIDTAGQVILH